MGLEEQASSLQAMKKKAKLDLQDPRQQLLSELTDTVSLLCHQVSLLGEVSDGMNETLAVLEEQMECLFEPEEAPESGMGEEEYFDGAERPLYEVKCPQCKEQFAVDEDSLVKGFRCPTCGEHLVQAE